MKRLVLAAAAAVLAVWAPTHGDVNESHTVVVVGAGIAGLSAAFFLADTDVMVLEPSPHVGGRTTAGRWNDRVYGKGTQYIGLPQGGLADILSALDLTPLDIPAPMDAHYHGGRFHLGMTALARLYAEEGGIQAVNRFGAAVRELGLLYQEVPEFEIDGPLARYDRMTARQWLEEMKLPPIYHDRLNASARGLFGANLDEISALAMLPEVAFKFGDWEPVRSLQDLDGSGSGDDADGSKEFTGAYTFPGGIADISEGLARHLGSRIHLRVSVSAITPADGGGLTVAYEDAAGVPRQISAEAVILATPAPVSAAIGQSALNREQRDILTQIPYASTTTVALFGSRPVFDRAFNLAVPDGWLFTNLFDATWSGPVSGSAPAPDGGYISVVHVVPRGFRDRERLPLSDQDLVESVLTELERIFPEVRAGLTGWEVTRHPYAFPVMTPGAYARLQRLWRITGGPLFLAGDYTIYPTFEAAADSGAFAARMVRERLER